MIAPCHDSPLTSGSSGSTEHVSGAHPGDTGRESARKPPDGVTTVYPLVAGAYSVPPAQHSSPGLVISNAEWHGEKEGIKVVSTLKRFNVEVSFVGGASSGVDMRFDGTEVLYRLVYSDGSEVPAISSSQDSPRPPLTLAGEIGSVKLANGRAKISLNLQPQSSKHNDKLFRLRFQLVDQPCFTAETDAFTTKTKVSRPKREAEQAARAAGLQPPSQAQPRPPSHKRTMSGSGPSHDHPMADRDGSAAAPSPSMDNFLAATCDDGGTAPIPDCLTAATLLAALRQSASLVPQSAATASTTVTNR